MFIYNIFGYIIIFQCTLFQIKKNVKKYASKNLSEKELTIIKLTNSNNIKWIDGSELIYKGELFDVIKQKTIDKITYLYCINDKTEEKLFSELQKDLNKNSDNGLPVNKQSKSLLKLIPTFALIAIFKLQPIINYIDIIYKSDADLYISVSLDIISPPPKNTSFIS